MTSQGRANASQTCATAPPSISIACPPSSAERRSRVLSQFRYWSPVQHCAVDDLVGDRDSLEPFLHPGKQFRIDRVAESIAGVDDRGMARLIGAHALVLEHARIVLNERSATTTSPIDNAGSSPPATPEKTTVRQPNRSASSVVTIAALTLPSRPGQHHLCPSSIPVTKRICAAVLDCGSPTRVTLQGGEFLRDRADQSDGHTAVCAKRLVVGYI